MNGSDVMTTAAQPEWGIVLWSLLALAAVLVAGGGATPWAFARAGVSRTGASRISAVTRAGRRWAQLVSMVSAPDPGAAPGPDAIADVDALDAASLDVFDLPAAEPAAAESPVAPPPEIPNPEPTSPEPTSPEAPAPEAAVPEASAPGGEPIPFPGGSGPTGTEPVAAEAPAQAPAPVADAAEPPAAAAEIAAPGTAAPESAAPEHAAPETATPESAAPAALPGEPGPPDASAAESADGAGDGSPGLVGRALGALSPSALPPLRADAQTLLPAALGAVVMFVVLQFGGALLPGGGGDGGSGDDALAAEIGRLSAEIEALGGAVLTLSGAATDLEGHAPAEDDATHTGEERTIRGADDTHADDTHADDAHAPDVDGDGDAQPSASATDAGGDTHDADDGSVGTHVSGLLPTGEEEAEADAHAAAGTDSHSPYFTDGRNLLNCSDFESWERAQEALEVNRPGDPNLLDLDGNGTACESLLRAATDDHGGGSSGSSRSNGGH